jgi:hypothetical protein
MRIARILSLAVSCGVLAVSAASAQEHGNVGITIGYPAAVGVVWHASDAVAIRPDFRISGSSTDPSGTNGWSLGTGVSALFYLGSTDNVRTYVSPRLDYQRNSTTITALAIEQTRTSHAWGVAGSFGAEYTPNRRFGVFGEIGFGYSRLKLDALSPIVSATTAHGWGTRAGVGVIFYPGS